MADDKTPGGIHIDSDWKQEAAREKERLTETAEKQGAGGEPPVDFVELINILALQAAISLGGYQGPGGEKIAPNPLAAKHYIDLLTMLEKKTKGNLTDEEQRILGSVLYELRMQFVATSTPGRPVPPPAA